MMFYLEGLSPKALVFLQFFFLLLSHSFQGLSEGVGNPPSVVALVGEDVVLPCRLDPAADAFSMIVEWRRPELKPRFVHLWHEGQNLLANQNPSYEGRTSLSTDKLRQGDLSLALLNVKHSDNGIYRCFIPKMNKESTVKLIIGSVSSPVITDVRLSGDKDVLSCESKGWYPEPELLWLDGEGRVLSSGRAETISGPHGLFTVSSSVSVEKSDDNSFTCRVQQKSINQTRETHIHVAAENISGSSARIAVILVAFCICFTAICFLLYKMHHQKPELKSFNQEDQCTEQQNQPLTETSQSEPKQSVETSEEQRKTLDALEEQWKNLESLINGFKNERKEMEENMKEIEKKLQAAKLVTEKDKAKGNFELIEIIMWAKKQLKDQGQRDRKFITDAQTVLYKTEMLHKNLKTAMAPEKENDLNQKSHSAEGAQRREN